MTKMVYDLSSAINATAHWTQLLIDSEYCTEKEKQKLVNAWDDYMRTLASVALRIAAATAGKLNLEDTINAERTKPERNGRKARPAKRNATND